MNAIPSSFQHVDRRLDLGLRPFWLVVLLAGGVGLFMLTLALGSVSINFE